MTPDDITYIINSAFWAALWFAIGYVLALTNKRLTSIEQHLKNLEEKNDDNT